MSFYIAKPASVCPIHALQCTVKSSNAHPSSPVQYQEEINDVETPNPNAIPSLYVHSSIKSLFAFSHPLPLLHPLPPPPILLPPRTLRLPLKPHNLQIRHLTPLLPPPSPPRLSHQRHNSLLLIPALLRRHIRQITSPVPLIPRIKTNPNPMHPELPIHRVFRALEIREQCDGYFERGELAERYWREAVVGEGGG